MKFCRFIPSGSSAQQPASALYGVIESDHVREISGPPWSAWSHGHAPGRLRTSVCWLLSIRGKSFVSGEITQRTRQSSAMKCPRSRSSSLKPPSAIIGPGEAIVLTPQSQRVEHEGELALIVGRRCSHLKDSDDALSYLLGYSCLNDVTARDLQKSDVQFTRAKGFDTFCPVGPHIETQLNPADVLVETHVNGALRQSGSTSLMAYPVAFLVRWISRVMTLFPGDLIATGTPAGVGPLVAGDIVEISISGVGVLRNPVQAPHT